MINIQRALKELKSISDSQWKNGMFPHIRFVKGESGYSPDYEEWGAFNKTKKDIFFTSGITQPPVLAIALQKILEDKNAKLFTNEVLDIAASIEQFHDFLLRERDPYNEHLVTIIHPWESGLDNSPIYDLANENAKKVLDELHIQQQIKKRQDLQRVIKEFRPGEKDYEVYGKLIGYFKKYDYEQLELAKHSPFRIQDILFNAILFKAIVAMTKVYKYLYEVTDDKIHLQLFEKNVQLSQKIFSAIDKKLYDRESGEYYSFDLCNSSLIKIETVHSLVAKIYFSQEEFTKIFKAYQDSEALPFLSTSNHSKYFNPLQYWRGPVWPIINWLIIEHLKSKNIESAIEYSKQTLKMISEGFDVDGTAHNAVELLYFNLVDDSFTTPSKNQYKHGWLWDSGFAAIGWICVKEQPTSNIFQNIYDFKNELIKQKVDIRSIRETLKQKYQIALFDEYYVGIQTKDYVKGEAIGSEMMTWTAAVFLDLYSFIKDHYPTYASSSPL